MNELQKEDARAKTFAERAGLFQKAAERFERRANAISLGRLVAFGLAVAFAGAGFTQGSTLWKSLAGVAAAAFAGLVAWHWRTIAQRDDAQVRKDVLDRHLARITEGWAAFKSTGTEWLEATHEYAYDIDLVGEGSLFQRIDTTHTRRGARTLASWLGYAAPIEVSRERQKAVAELTDRLDFRVELEAAARVVGADKLDADPFLQFTRLPRFFERVPLLVVVIHALPIVTVGLWFTSSWLPAPMNRAWLVMLVVQALLFMSTTGVTGRTFDLVAARRSYVDAYQKMLTVIGQESFEADVLRRIRSRLSPSGSPQTLFSGLDRWTGFAELRTQFPLHWLANVFLLWDLHVLWHLERWNRSVGASLDDVFDALGEFEALCSLACFAHVEPGSTFPELQPSTAPFLAEGIAHPLLPARSRVANDVRLRGPGTALIVTGSNMAGKSTLLRAVGLNLSLAMAGGTVCAVRMHVPQTRLRASMRAQDSLQRGASYFHAELSKLRQVVSDGDEPPPIFFLLDELLRGTNANARHLGSRAVLEHLLKRNATGIVATHDVALAALENVRPDDIENAHFTDVLEDGEMTFDYRLRSGVVQTSNALRLLRLAGIDVNELDASAST